MSKSMHPKEIEQKIKAERKDDKEHCIVISGLSKDALYDLENWFIQTRCDYIRFKVGGTYIHDNDIDEEWYIENV